MNDRELLERFKRRYRLAAIQRGLTIGKLAKSIGCSRQALTQKMPSSSRLMKMADVLDVSLEYLLGADDVDAQIDAVFQDKIVPMTERQRHMIAEMGGLEDRVSRIENHLVLD